MAEYITKDKAKELVCEFCTWAGTSNCEECEHPVDDVPAADVVPVVRCKDCRHRDPEDHKCDSGEFERQGCPFKVADNYFCAYGERNNCGAKEVKT